MAEVGKYPAEALNAAAELVTQVNGYTPFSKRYGTAVLILDLITAGEDEPHLIEFADDGWIIQHPLRERMAGHLFHCQQRWTGERPTIGRFILNEDGTIGDPVEQ